MTATQTNKMTNLDQLEAQSVFILREAYRSFKDMVMLWSIGKDSTVLLWLARKAFFGHVPIPLMHIDTCYKIPAMIEYRDKFANNRDSFDRIFYNPADSKIVNHMTASS